MEKLSMIGPRFESATVENNRRKINELIGVVSSLEIAVNSLLQRIHFNGTAAEQLDPLYWCEHFIVKSRDPLQYVMNDTFRYVKDESNKVQITIARDSQKAHFCLICGKPRPQASYPTEEI